MTALYLPWLVGAIHIPLVGSVWVGRMRDADRASRWSAAFSAIALVCALGASAEFFARGAIDAADPWDVAPHLMGRHLFVIDSLSAPLLPLAALLYLLTSVVTLRTKVRRFSFAWTLASEAMILATLSTEEPWLIIALMSAGTLAPYIELKARRKPTRVFASHMLLFVILLVVGWSLVEANGRQMLASTWAILPLLAAIFIRSGMVPVHCWMTDLFEHATFGTALLFVTPIPAAYAAVRLILPIAPDWVLHSIGWISLLTAVYAACMTLVQREARRFFCYLFLSHSALVLVGLETATPIGLTGGLCVWLSVGLSLAGFGLTLRAIEARHGRLSLASYHGLYEHTPALAMAYLLTGLASVGFPGTFGFIGTELLVDGAVHAYPYIGVVVVLAAALNGIAVVKSYFTLFTGTRYISSVPLAIGLRERFAVLALAALILFGGFFPQPGVASRYHAAMQIIKERAAVSTLAAAYVRTDDKLTHD